MAITYGTVKGTFTSAEIHDSNSGVSAAPLRGYVSFTPAVTSVSDGVDDTIFLPRPVRATLNSKGFFSVKLAATDDTGNVPTGWTYRVDFHFEDDQGLDPFHMGVPGGQTIDLADVVPVAESSGYGYVNFEELIEAAVIATGAGGAYKAITISGTATEAVTKDTSLDISLTGDATFSVTGTRLGCIVGLRVDPNNHTLTLPGDLIIEGEDPVTATAWRMAEGWVYSISGLSGVEPPDPGDTTPPVAGTLASSDITDSGFTLTVTGASDESALHSLPYAFSIDNGATWSGWQSSPVYVVTGRSPSAEHQCLHQVRDNADPPHTTLGSSITVTTTAAPGILTFRGEARQGAAADSFTYSAVPLGTADANRWVVVAVTWWASGARTANLTINGVAATQVYAPAPVSGSGSRWFIAPVPTGTTADFVATTTTSGQLLSPSIAVWTANQQISFVAGRVESPTAISGDTFESLTATSVVGGFACAGFRTVSAAVSTTWTGVTERWDSAAAQPTSGGDAETTGTSFTATMTFSPALTGNCQASLATFRWGT